MSILWYIILLPLILFGIATVIAVCFWLFYFLVLLPWSGIIDLIFKTNYSQGLLDFLDSDDESAF